MDSYGSNHQNLHSVAQFLYFRRTTFHRYVALNERDATDTASAAHQYSDDEPVPDKSLRQSPLLKCPAPRAEIINKHQITLKKPLNR